AMGIFDRITGQCNREAPGAFMTLCASD
ncbi:MAG: hypothetical protein JWL62_2123, partial [Hyphomicrobiales bacterium]|nr:hypothetical protein [Hyphomicrobiales bacterium]